MNATTLNLTATETIERGMLVKKTASGNGAAKLGTGDPASEFFGVALNRATLGQAVAVLAAPGEPVLVYADGAAQLVEGSAWGPSSAVAGAASGAASTQLGIVTQTAPNTAGALAACVAQGAGTGSGAGSLQEAYDGGEVIECAAATPVEIIVDPTNEDGIQFKSPADADMGTISAFSGAGGLALYGSATDGARIAARTQSGSNTGATCGIVAGRGGPTAGTGGQAFVTGGQGGTTNGAGGEGKVSGGLGSGSGTGGAATVVGGGNGGTGTGGAASVTGGASTGASGTGGAASLAGGASTNGTGGTVSVQAGDGSTDGNINIGTSKAVNTTVQAASLVSVSLQSQTNGAVAIDASQTTLRGANANANTITLSAAGIGGTPRMSFFGAAVVDPQTVTALTNNVTSGGTSDQVDNWTDLTTYATDAAAIRNAVYQLARKVAQLQAALDAYGLV